MGFALDEPERFALNGIDAAWIDEGTKATWRREWSDEIHAIFAGSTTTRAAMGPPTTGA